MSIFKKNKSKRKKYDQDDIDNAYLTGFGLGVSCGEKAQKAFPLDHEVICIAADRYVQEIDSDPGKLILAARALVGRTIELAEK